MTLPSKMRAVEINKPGGPEELVQSERPLQTPKANEIVVKVAAAGVTRPAILHSQGLYAGPRHACSLPWREIAAE